MIIIIINYTNCLVSPADSRWRVHMRYRIHQSGWRRRCKDGQMDCRLDSRWCMFHWWCSSLAARSSRPSRSILSGHAAGSRTSTEISRTYIVAMRLFTAPLAVTAHGACRKARMMQLAKKMFPEGKLLDGKESQHCR